MKIRGNSDIIKAERQKNIKIRPNNLCKYEKASTNVWQKHGRKIFPLVARILSISSFPLLAVESCSYFAAIGNEDCVAYYTIIPRSFKK